MMFAAGPVDVWLGSRWRHKGLAREDDVPRFTFLAQMLGDLRMVSLHVADEPA